MNSITAEVESALAAEQREAEVLEQAHRPCAAAAPACPCEATQAAAAVRPA
jgi:hypothetical protein